MDPYIETLNPSIPERCRDCPYIADKTATIAANEEAKSEMIGTGFERIDHTAEAEIDDRIFRTADERRDELRRDIAGEEVPFDTVLERTLNGIEDPEEQTKFLEEYMQVTQGIFDEPAYIEAYKAGKVELPEALDGAKLLAYGDTVSKLGKAVSKLIDHSEQYIVAMDNQSDHCRQRTQEAIELCKNGVKDSKRFRLFGRPVVRCGSRLTYTWGFWGEMPAKPAESESSI